MQRVARDLSRAPGVCHGLAPVVGISAQLKAFSMFLFTTARGEIVAKFPNVGRRNLARPIAPRIADVSEDVRDLPLRDSPEKRFRHSCRVSA